jgi:hypothetical protein
MIAKTRISGGCHCGAVRFVATVPASVTILDCNCSICAKAGFRHLIVGGEDFRLERGQDHLVSYRFGTGTAEHLFCGACGIKSFYRPRSHPDGWSVNWNAVDDTSGIEARFERFDGRNWEDARAGIDRMA